MRTTPTITRCMPMSTVNEYLNKKLQDRIAAGNLRSLTDPVSGIDFYSNDYLGLATTGILTSRLKDIPSDRCGTGSTGSRLLSGNSVAARELEEQIARFHDAEAALLFNSGYNANNGLIGSVASRETSIYYDELCHASIHDGIRLSIARQHHKFRHNDITDLERLLLRHPGDTPAIIIVESVYSMDGDLAPLASLAEKATTYNASLIVDEAHATGVFGPKGEGLVCHMGLQNKVFARVHTFGKALGCHGAAVVGSHRLKQFLINFSRPFIYTTALPGHAIQAANAAYGYLASDEFSPGRLHKIIGYFRSKTATSPVKWMDSSSAIQAVQIRDNARCRMVATALQQAGMIVKPILSPTVPAGTERIRVCLHAYNTPTQIDTLFNLLEMHA